MMRQNKFDNPNAGWEAYTQRANQMLLSSGLRIQNIPRDGDCLFTAVASNFAGDNPNSNQMYLRQAVGQWVRNHIDDDVNIETGMNLAQETVIQFWDGHGDRLLDFLKIQRIQLPENFTINMDIPDNKAFMTDIYIRIMCGGDLYNAAKKIRNGEYSSLIYGTATEAQILSEEVIHKQITIYLINRNTNILEPMFFGASFAHLGLINLFWRDPHFDNLVPIQQQYTSALGNVLTGNNLLRGSIRQPIGNQKKPSSRLFSNYPSSSASSNLQSIFQRNDRRKEYESEVQFIDRLFSLSEQPLRVNLDLTENGTLNGTLYQCIASCIPDESDEGMQVSGPEKGAKLQSDVENWTRANKQWVEKSEYVKNELSYFDEVSQLKKNLPSAYDSYCVTNTFYPVLLYNFVIS